MTLRHLLDPRPAGHAARPLTRALPLDSNHEPPPVLPSLADVERAMLNHPFAGSVHPGMDCWVCSPSRRDGLQVTLGPLRGNRDVLGALLRVPGTSALSGEVVRAALYCSSYPAEAARERRMCQLTSIEVIQHRAIRGGEVLGVVGWTRRVDGRTYGSASALFDATGTIVASAQTLWVAYRRRWRTERIAS